MDNTIQKNRKKFMNLIKKFGGSDNLTPTQVDELCNIPIMLSSPKTLEEWLELYEMTKEKDSYYTHTSFREIRVSERRRKRICEFFRELAKENKIQKLGCGESHCIEDLYVYVHFFS